MLNMNLEKKNEERLIMRKEVFAGVATTSPFESTDNVILSGSISEIVRGHLELRPTQKVNITLSNSNISLKEKQIQEALREVKRFPGNHLVLNNLGLTYLSLGELDKAIETFKRVQELKPDFIVGALNLASVYLAKKQDELALTIYNELNNRSSGDERVLINIANIHFKNRRLAPAKKLYKQITKNNPRNIASHNRLALIYLLEGKSNSTISELRKCLAFNINSPAIYNNLGIAYGVKGLLAKAKEAFSIALKIAPNYINAIYNLAEILKANNRISEAIEILEGYLETNESGKVRELLARCYLENKQYLASLRILLNLLIKEKKVKPRKEKIARLHNNIGVVYHTMRDFENAESSYFKCIEAVEYANEVILCNIIDLYLGLRKMKYAKKYIDILYDKFGVNSFYFYYLSLYASYTSQFDESIKIMKKFIKINKKFSPAYAFLSFAYSEYMHDYKRAVELNKEGIKYLPKNITIINNLAYNSLMDNNISEAKKLLEKAKLVTNNLFIVATTGLLRIKEGNIVEGARLYDLAISMAMSKHLRKQIIQKKHIELAKHYLINKNEKEAKLNLNKALLINIENSVYTKQTEELLKSLS